MGTHRAVQPGRRRAARPARATLLQRIPAGLTVVGLLALGAAGTGAVALDSPASAGGLSAGARTSLTGTDAVGFTSARELAISRDSERQAMADAANAQLVQAT